MVRQYNNSIERRQQETRSRNQRKNEKLEEAGHRFYAKKCKFSKRKIKWVRDKIDQQGIQPLQDNWEAITNLNTPKTKKV